MPTYHIDDKMYGEKITLVHNCSAKWFKSYVKRLYGILPQLSMMDGLFYEVQRQNSTSHYFIWLKTFEWRVYEYGVLAHEVFHCVSTILLYLGMRLSQDSEEAFAYYYQSIFQECIHGLSKSIKIN
jgi:hypothetical protein